MKKAGGHRNFGYGKQMTWAGKLALRDQYGNGHYGTITGHAERWRRFVTWCRDERDIRDARLINREVVQDYGKSLRDKVDAGMSPAYAQNLLSSVNVVMQAMRSDRQIRGAVNITAGTKGGRGHRVDRWVPVSGAAIGCLVRAARAQRSGRNLIPSHLTWKQWYSHIHHVWASVRDDYGLKKIHDLRAAYACERYKQLTGSVAPVMAGRQLANRNTDRAARQTIAQELGHARIEVIASYIGGAR